VASIGRPQPAPPLRWCRRRPAARRRMSGGSRTRRWCTRHCTRIPPSLVHIGACGSLTSFADPFLNRKAAKSPVAVVLTYTMLRHALSPWILRVPQCCAPFHIVTSWPAYDFGHEDVPIQTSAMGQATGMAWEMGQPSVAHFVATDIGSRSCKTTIDTLIFGTKMALY
jgi:hypothetical protein